MQATNYLPSFVLAALMFMHQCQSNPTKTDDDSYEKQLNEMLIYASKNLDRIKLFDFTMAALNTVGDVSKQFVWENIEAILKDPAITEVKTDNMQEYNSNLNAIVQNYKDSPIVTIPLHEFKFYLRTIGLNVNAKRVSGEKELLIKELRKRIIDPMENKIEENYSKMLDALVKVVEQYLNNLSEEEKVREDYMEHWVKLFKEENNMEKKTELLGVFMKYF